MRELNGKVVVVTGAASGLGRALAIRFAAEGMKLVLADIEQPRLEATAVEIRTTGADVLAVTTDVSDATSVAALASAAMSTYGKVHILCNNAGVLGSGLPIWESSVTDWQWTLGVNLWGVIHGIRSFLPLMLVHGEGGHVVNTASVSGLIPGGGIYGVSKHGVVSLSETLYTQLKTRGSKIGVSVLCPGYVATNLIDSDRNRPAELAPDDETQFNEAMRQEARNRLAGGLSPERMAEQVLNAIRGDQFYILTHDEYDDMIRTRMENILSHRNPAVAAPA